jgi:dienelactone hydrolase
MMTRRLALAGAALIAVALLAAAGRRDLHGLALVVRAANVQGLARRLADIDTVRVQDRLVTIPDPAGPMRARVYAPVGTARQTVLLVSGLHPTGIDEPRLVALARTLAEANVIVVTPDIPELSRFEVTPVVTDRIEAAALWLAARSGLAPTGRIGLMGVSFSGGLAVVAAGRPSLRDRLLYVFSLGGHDDLRRVLEYLCSGRERDGVAQLLPPPHDYGVAVVLLNVAERLVPPDQLEPLRAAVRRFLWASYLDRIDPPRARDEFTALRGVARALPEPAATLLRYVNDRDVAHLGPLLQPYVGLYADQPALSPARSPAPSVPVFLLHGRDDNVIPASESRYLADRLRGRVPVRLLVTDLLSHVDTDQPAGIASVLALARFWGALLDR